MTRQTVATLESFIFTLIKSFVVVTYSSDIEILHNCIDQFFHSCDICCFKPHHSIRSSSFTKCWHWNMSETGHSPIVAQKESECASWFVPIGSLSKDRFCSTLFDVISWASKVRNKKAPQTGRTLMSVRAFDRCSAVKWPWAYHCAQKFATVFKCWHDPFLQVYIRRGVGMHANFWFIRQTTARRILAEPSGILTWTIYQETNIKNLIAASVEWATDVHLSHHIMFRSQISDNMDRWKAEMEESAERREEKKKEEQKEKVSEERRSRCAKR